MGGEPGSGRWRAQSSPVAVVLVFGLVIASTTAMVVLGASALQSSQGQIGANTAENAMTQLDSRASLVALGSSSVQEVDIGQGDYGVVGGGQLTVTVDGTPILQEELGSIVYRTESDTTIAYQGGGVWRTDGSGNTVMVSPPELHYRNETLTLPLVTVGGEGTLDRRAVISDNGSTQVYPNTTQSRANPVDDGRIEVIVQSEYYEGWETYFESRTTGGVSITGVNEVTLSLLQRDERTVRNAISIGGGSSGTLRLQSGDTFVVDSYRSTGSEGPNNPPTATGSADTETGMNVNFNGNSQIEGTLTTAGSVSFGGGSSGVTGNLRYGDGTVSTSDCNSHVGGWCNDNASIEQPPSLDNEIDETITRIGSERNNSEANCVSAAEGLRYSTAGCGSSITLEAGDYYIDNQDLQVGSSQQLILNTSGGDINIALDGDRAVDISGNVTVTGTGRVSVYATDQVGFTGNDAEVWNRGWDAEQFWVYCDAGCEIDVTQGAQVNGVIYAPPEPGGSNGNVEIRQGAEVYGAIMAGGEGTAELGQNSEIHFDRDLSSTEVFGRATVPSISYLHVSVSRLNVTSP